MVLGTDLCLISWYKGNAYAS